MIKMKQMKIGEEEGEVKPSKKRKKRSSEKISPEKEKPEKKNRKGEEDREVENEKKRKPRTQFPDMTVPELKQECQDRYIKGVSKMKKAALIVKLSAVVAADKGQQLMDRNSKYAKQGREWQQQQRGGGGGRGGDSWKEKPPDMGDHRNGKDNGKIKISMKAENSNDCTNMDDKIVWKQARRSTGGDGEAGEARGFGVGGGEDNDGAHLHKNKQQKPPGEKEGT